MRRTSLILFLLGLSLAACTPRSLREAQDVVAQADSLWKAGQMYADSACLARSFHTLEHWQWVYADDYAHACYHYGRLLRERENPVAAMECFINATHSHTRDYHILGRVYSNMGSICHLANEFPLSYDMYEKSADMFLRNGDSLLYYYGLNNMAFELAEQGKKEETLLLLDSLNYCCLDSNILNKTWETRAKIYKKVGQYDSAIYCVNNQKWINPHNSLGYIIKAQSFSKLGEQDSAVKYARIVLADTLSSYRNRFNALYIISHRDSTLGKEDVQNLATLREDIRYNDYEPEKEKLTLAMQLLNEDINDVPNYSRFFIMGGALVLLFGLLAIITYRLRRKRELFLVEKEETMNALAEKEEQFSQRRQAIIDEIENGCQVLRNEPNLREFLHWKQYDKMCRIIDRQFYLLASKLKDIETLNERDVQLCVLVWIDLCHADIANMMYVEEGSVGKLKERTAKKLKTSRKQLRKTLFSIVLGEPEYKLSSL